MTESMPPTPEEIRRLNRDLMEKVLDRAASDPAWKQRLLDDPEAAMAEAGFPEARQLREIQASVGAQEEAEVSGQIVAFSAVRHGTGAHKGACVDPTPFG